MFGMHVVVVVRGREAADEVYRAVDRVVGDSVVQVPRLAAAGWWLIDADVSAHGVEAVGEQLAAKTALMIVGAAADMAVISAFEAGRDPVEVFVGEAALAAGMPPRVTDEPRFAEWARRVAPRRPVPASLTKFVSDLEGENGEEIIGAVLPRLGFAYRGRDPIGLCEGCIAIIDYHPFIIGETRVDWSTVRWPIGLGEDADGRWLGMWDLDIPGPPVHRWPVDAAGRVAAKELQYELVARPIMAATNLDGTRRWTSLKPTQSASAAFYHYSLDGRLSVAVTTDPPRTLDASIEPGYAVGYSDNSLRAVGYDDDDLSRRRNSWMPIRDAADAERIATASIYRHIDYRWGVDPSPWIDIPPDVPRGYLDTAEWVRTTAKS